MPSERCTTCKKKLGVVVHTCKCTMKFCTGHLPPHEHACTFDYKKEGAKEIQKIMDSEPRVSSFERI